MCFWATWICFYWKSSRSYYHTNIDYERSKNLLYISLEINYWNRIFFITKRECGGKPELSLNSLRLTQLTSNRNRAWHFQSAGRWLRRTVNNEAGKHVSRQRRPQFWLAHRCLLLSNRWKTTLKLEEPGEPLLLSITVYLQVQCSYQYIQGVYLFPSVKFSESTYFDGPQFHTRIFRCWRHQKTVYEQIFFLYRAELNCIYLFGHPYCLNQVL